MFELFQTLRIYGVNMVDSKRELTQMRVKGDYLLR